MRGAVGCCSASVSECLSVFSSEEAESLKMKIKFNFSHILNYKMGSGMVPMSMSNLHCVHGFEQQ